MDISPCPQCGSGDVHFCNISVRPYCADCSYWGKINFGTKEDSIALWNSQYQKHFLTPKQNPTELVITVSISSQ